LKNLKNNMLKKKSYWFRYALFFILGLFCMLAMQKFEYQACHEAIKDVIFK